MSNLQALENPGVPVVGAHLLIITALTLWQIYKNRKRKTKGKSLALWLHLCLSLAPDVYALFTLSNYTYIAPPSW